MSFVVVDMEYLTSVTSLLDICEMFNDINNTIQYNTI